jgi:hypothetical protein
VVAGHSYASMWGREELRVQVAKLTEREVSMKVS